MNARQEHRTGPNPWIPSWNLTCWVKIRSETHGLGTGCTLALCIACGSPDTENYHDDAGTCIASRAAPALNHGLSDNPRAILGEVLAFYGPRAHRRVFRAGTWLEWKRAEREFNPNEPLHPGYEGLTVGDLIDLTEEARLAYQRTWTVEQVAETVADLRARGYRDVRPKRDGSLLVVVDRATDPERAQRRAEPLVPVVRFAFVSELEGGT